MDVQKKFRFKSGYKISKMSMAISVISLTLAPLLFVRIEFVYRRADAMEIELGNRIQGIEEDMQAKVQTIVQAMLQSSEFSTARQGKESDNVIFGKSNLSFV